MRKSVILIVMIVASLALISVFHYFQWVMFEWTRPLVLIPLVYAGMHYRRSGSITVLTLLTAAQGPVLLFTYARNPSSGFNYMVAGIALGFLGVYIGHIMRKEMEIRSVWQQAEVLRKRVWENRSIEEMLSLLEKLFSERGRSDTVEIYIYNEDMLLVDYREPDAPQLPEGHLYYEVARRDKYLVSASVEDDPRIACSSDDKRAAPVSRIAVFPIDYSGRTQGVVSIVNTRDDNFDSETARNLVSIKQTVERFLTLLEKRQTTIQHKLQHERIRHTFSSYVSQTVADEILKNPDMIDLGGRQQRTTVMFTEVVNFRELQKTQDPAGLIAMLNEFFSIAIDTIFEYDGTLDKFIGNNIMAFWGAPIEISGAEERAVSCALKLQERIDARNKVWVESGRQPFSVCIGINSGDVVAGNIGSVRRMEYTVIGDTVNTASRVKSLSKEVGAPILVSETTYEKVKEKFDFGEHFRATVKGKAEEITVYRIGA